MYFSNWSVLIVFQELQLAKTDVVPTTTATADKASGYLECVLVVISLCGRFGALLNTFSKLPTVTTLFRSGLGISYTAHILPASIHFLCTFVFTLELCIFVFRGPFMVSCDSEQLESLGDQSVCVFLLLERTRHSTLSSEREIKTKDHHD